MVQYRTIIGDFVDCAEFGQMRFRTDCTMVINCETGEITKLGPNEEPVGEIIKLPKGRFVIPGFIDVHCHAPQFPNSAGRGCDMPLLEWLEKITFPTEAKFADVAHAKTVYARAINGSLLSGTTCCVYFGSVHTEATKALADCAKAAGQRAYVGKVCMDCRCPESVRDASIEAAVDGTVDIMRHLEGEVLVKPVITPRFAPVCSESLLRRLGDLSKSRPDCLVQSHVSENQNEIKWMAELFPSQSYAEVYDKFGLLNKTILAHAIYLSDAEIDLLKSKNVALAHCPISNFAINSGIMPVRKLLDRGLTIGLGSDVSGGWTPSIFEQMRYAIVASKAVSFDSHLTMAEAFYLGTRGGANCIQRDDLGRFDVGCKFDALVIDCTPSDNKLFCMPDDTLHDTFTRFFFNGDDRHICSRFVNGREQNV